MLDGAGNFQTLVIAKERVALPGGAPSMNFWLMTLLHAWYPQIVEQQYPLLRDRYLLDGPGGSKWIEPLPLPGEGPEALRPAVDMAWAACCASELGDTSTLNGLLAYADQFLNPVWENGAYYYKRRDANFDSDGNFVGMDPASGNAFYNYARLNVKDGLKKLFEGPWDDRHFAEPALIDLPDDLGVRRACFDAERDALVLTLGALTIPRSITLEIRASQERDLPVVLKDGVALQSGIRRSDQGFLVELDHGERSTLVFQW